MKLLKSSQLKGINKPGMYRVDLGVYLRIAPGGSKQFVQRIMVHGKRLDLGLGGWPTTTLSEAKNKAICNRAKVLNGEHPITSRSTPRLVKKDNPTVPLFKDVQDETLASLKSTWRNPKTGKNWKEGMDKYVTPAIGNMPIDKISREDILNILIPIWTTKPNLARKIRQRISAVFKLSMAYGYIECNFAGEMIDGALPKQKIVKTHHRALPYSKIPKLLKAVAHANVDIVVKAAIYWILLTACRTGEARYATWQEIDMKYRIWKIPSSRMKANKEHRVPITDGMVVILKVIKLAVGGSGYLFPSTKKPGNPLGENSFSNLIRQIGFSEMTTIHGLRSSFRDWAAEKGVNRELAEQALAHAIQGVEGCYFRSDLFKRRRAIMKQWDDHCTKSGAINISNLLACGTEN